MNDFSRSSDLLFSILFADDTSVFIEGTNFENISKISNTELEKVNMWLKANKLTINTKKTHYMMFHRTRIKHNTNIKILINNNIMDHINNTKFLGVIIDSKLNWTAHILYIKKQNFKIYWYSTQDMIFFLQNNTMRNMYFTFIYPYFIYCIEVWGNAQHMHLDPLIKIQKKSIQTIRFSHYLAHTEPLFERQIFKKLIIQRISLIMF